MLKVYAVTDRDFKELVSEKRCRLCGEVLSAQHAVTVKSSYIQSGTSYKDARSGHSYTVHDSGRHYLVTTALSLRKSASTGAKRLAVLPARKVVKTSAAVMGSDGFWWGKVKVSGKVGWVQMRYLSIRGTASAPSYDSRGVNVYTGLTKARTKRLAALRKSVSSKARTLRLGKAAKAYRAAYTGARNQVASYKAGRKLKVVKVVTNRYNALFAKLSNGSYVALEKFK